MRHTEAKYDLAVYALVDSLMLHSGYSSLRLENFLFTHEAFEDVKRTLAPGGVFAMYNYFRQGWVVTRLAAMAEETFGTKPPVVHRRTAAAHTSSSGAKPSRTYATSRSVSSTPTGYDTNTSARIESWMPTSQPSQRCSATAHVRR